MLDMNSHVTYNRTRSITTQAASRQYTIRNLQCSYALLNKELHDSQPWSKRKNHYSAMSAVHDRWLPLPPLQQRHVLPALPSQLSAHGAGQPAKQEQMLRMWHHAVKR
jgi:hypothetical protein